MLTVFIYGVASIGLIRHRLSRLAHRLYFMYMIYAKCADPVVMWVLHSLSMQTMYKIPSSITLLHFYYMHACARDEILCYIMLCFAMFFFSFFLSSSC